MCAITDGVITGTDWREELKKQTLNQSETVNCKKAVSSGQRFEREQNILDDRR